MDTLGDLRVGLPRAGGTPDGTDGSRADPSSSPSESPPAIAGEDGGDATASTASTVAPKLNVSMAAFEVMDEIGEGCSPRFCSCGAARTVRTKPRWRSR